MIERQDLLEERGQDFGGTAINKGRDLVEDQMDLSKL
jgi:hypothetical protein